jgi:excisionase family DNA binding protein
MESQRQLVRAFEVGVKLGYSTKTVKRWAKEGKLPGAVLLTGGHVRFDPDAIDTFIANGGVATPTTTLLDRLSDVLSGTKTLLAGIDRITCEETQRSIQL